MVFSAAYVTSPMGGGPIVQRCTVDNHFSYISLNANVSQSQFEPGKSLFIFDFGISEISIFEFRISRFIDPGLRKSNRAGACRPGPGRHGPALSWKFQKSNHPRRACSSANRFPVGAF